MLTPSTAAKSLATPPELMALRPYIAAGRLSRVDALAISWSPTASKVYLNGVLLHRSTRRSTQLSEVGINGWANFYTFSGSSMSLPSLTSSVPM
jgi:hypothetical protein